MNLTHITPTQSLARLAASLYDLHTIALSFLLCEKCINRWLFMYQQSLYFRAELIRWKVLKK